MKNIGDRFGRLLIISKADNIFTGGQSRKAFVCKCDCGKIVTRLSQNLRSSGSCGCVNVERLRAIGKRTGKDRFWNYTHGMFGTRFYNIYHGIMGRCNTESHPSYRFYGLIGIRNKFKNFEHFYETMFASYKRHIKKYGERQTTIDRIDSAKDYYPKNCRWATYREQGNNRRDNLVLEYKGKKDTLANWSNKFKLSKHLTYHKITALNYNTKLPNDCDILK